MDFSDNMDSASSKANKATWVCPACCEPYKSGQQFDNRLFAIYLDDDIEEMAKGRSRGCAVAR
eukprot:671627-Prorocentrum_lima.AAC.1